MASDRGSATVWAVGAIAVLCVVFGSVLAVGQAIAIRHRAAGAADLAALAAADHWARGGDAACATADRVARAQGGRLVRCAVEGEISDVTAASGAGPLTSEVRARAGPPGPPDGSLGSAGPVGAGLSGGFLGPPSPQGGTLSPPGPVAPDPVDAGLTPPAPRTAVP
ncbi:Rv3654c family TadE-like protein [Streptomyces sp. NPDC002845]